MFSRRHWIPPLGLLTGHLAHGASWIVLFGLAASVDAGVSLGELAWVHLVALGWLTLVALSVLLHVIPAFTDKQWRAEGIARGALVAYAIGAFGMVAAFGSADFSLLPGFAGLLALGLLAYLVLAFATLFVPPPADRVERAVARALGITLVFLAGAATLGTILVGALRSGGPALALAPAHADLALLGWLSLLVIGVSTRTLRVITGNSVRMPALHIAVGTVGVAGVILCAIGLGGSYPVLTLVGAAFLAATALLYLVQLGLVLAGRTNPHLPPQAFVAASGAWLFVATYLGLVTIAGRPDGRAFVFVILVGWLGQMVMAHLHHIGIRLLSTIARGDDDETRPQELLDLRLSWTTFIASQFAVFAGAWGVLVASPRAVDAAGACGIVAWLAMTLNVVTAWRKANAPGRTIVLS